MASSISGSDKTDNLSNHWTSDDTEDSFSNDQISGEMDLDSDVELDVTTGGKCDGKEFLPKSNAEINVGSINSRSNTLFDKQSFSKLHLDNKDWTSNEIPDLVGDDDSDSTKVFNDDNLEDELPNEADDDFIMKQLEKLIVRRNKKDNEARLRWLTFLREQKEAEEEAKQFQAYWERRHREDKDLWRDKDFANAVYKMSRAGYKGKHGDFNVPNETVQQMNALYMQITVGDYDFKSSLDAVMQNSCDDTR
uniref:Uncharacterized protein n=1 Tax=Setaria digitata TaxID=48799 RepID=A0A915Q0T7_9BILA